VGGAQPAGQPKAPRAAGPEERQSLLKPKEVVKTGVKPNEVPKPNPKVPLAQPNQTKMTLQEIEALNKWRKVNLFFVILTVFITIIFLQVLA
jgi:hypothetical protein